MMTLVAWAAGRIADLEATLRDQAIQLRAASESEQRACERAKAAEAEVERLRNALHSISLCSQNSASSKEECGRIARAALRETEREP